ncbi:MAG: hypothetical protein RIB47_02935 [Cyclobacteriaceae bacterium]
MKTSKIGILSILFAIFISCSDDENTPDFIGDSVGSYSYTVKIFRAGKTTAEIITGNLTLMRNEDDLSISLDDIETLKSSQLVLTPKGYVFDLEVATVTDDEGDAVNRAGKTLITVDGKPYHGRYDAEAKQLFINSTYTYQNTQFAQYNFSAEMTATKK